MKLIQDITQPPYMPKRCMHNIPYEYDDYGSIASAKRDTKENTLKEVSNKLHIPLDTLKASLQETSSYNDVHVTASSLVGVGTEYFNNIFIGDIPNQNNLPHSSKLCGYVEIDGTYHQCGHCEHETIIRQLIFNNENFREKYFETKASFYDRMPRGMLQEEYFAMKVLGFAKISSFENTPNQMVVFWYDKLTYKQTDFIYPR